MNRIISTISAAAVALPVAVALPIALALPIAVTVPALAGPFNSPVPCTRHVNRQRCEEREKAQFMRTCLQSESLSFCEFVYRLYTHKHSRK